MKKTILLLFFILTSLFLNSYISEHKKPKNEFISTPCAIFIMPTSKMTDSLQSANEDMYDVILDDNMHYMNLTRDYLDSLDMSIIDTVAEGKLKFKTTTNNVFEVNLSQNAWEVILFNGKDEPVEIDITNYETEIKKYLK